ncbi:MAG TPA: APC family permease [Bryobacteraceae bacterium]|nr:APC family permease [Bryobacteraceae bacterium]
MQTPTSPRPVSPGPELRRVLTLGDLVFYGIVLITPIAPVGVFGLASRMSHGHAATTILLAMLAMMLTAASYGRMAAIYPVAGSAYTYVSRGFNPHAGFLVGWAMFLDYLIIPVINTIYIALTLGRLFPQVPFAVWALLTVGSITLLNVRGVSFTARANQVLLAVMSVVIGVFLFDAVRYLWQLAGWPGVFSIKPFYNPQTFDLRSIATATSLAALTYIGFDGITTLAEEVRDPRRTVPLATVLTCLIIGILSTIEIYLAHQVWPNFWQFPNVETAFLDVCRRAGGEALFHAIAALLVIACWGSGLTGQAGAARLLYGMGRDAVLPRKFFGRLDARSGVPTGNVLLLGVLTFGAALAVSWEHAVELLNFGAFLAFMGVNLVCFRAVLANPGAHRRWTRALAPLGGFLFCLTIWLSLPLPAQVAGGAWFLAGVVFLAWRTRGFRIPPADLGFKES